MPTQDYAPASNPFAAGDDFPSFVTGVTLPVGVTAVYCDYPHVAKVEFKTVVVESWSGEEKRSAQMPARLQFVLRFEMLTPTDANTLWNHYLAQVGPLYSFSYFDYLSEEEFTVRYANTMMDRESFLHDAEKIGIELIQVL